MRLKLILVIEKKKKKKKEILFLIEFSYPTSEASDNNLDAQIQVAPIKFKLYKYDVYTSNILQDLRQNYWTVKCGLL